MIGKVKAIRHHLLLDCRVKAGFFVLHVYVDADACPVKPEVFRVAGRYRLCVTLVANSGMRIPNESWITLEVVKDGFDAADDWIVQHVQADDIVVTADIVLRCLAKGAAVTVRPENRGDHLGMLVQNTGARISAPLCCYVVTAIKGLIVT